MYISHPEFGRQDVTLYNESYDAEFGRAILY